MPHFLRFNRASNDPADADKVLVEIPIIPEQAKAIYQAGDCDRSFIHSQGIPTYDKVGRFDLETWIDFEEPAP